MLCNAKGVQGISGLGLMVGITTSRPAKDILNECIERGVLCLTAKEKIRLLPPLNIPTETLIKAINVLKEVCGKEI
jgi:acetylornithine/N-succinyldiaminopimelate aminotransferase